MSTKTAYILLIISILFEQVGTGFIGATHAFTVLKPTLVVIVTYFISYTMFAKILEKLNLSIAYSTWTALGTVTAALIGLFAYKQEISIIGWIAIVIICVGIVILNLFGAPKDESADAKELNGGEKR